MKLAGGRDEDKERSKEAGAREGGGSSERQGRKGHSEERRGRGGKRSPSEEKRSRREGGSSERKGRRGESEEMRSERKAKRSPSPVLKKSIRDRLGPSTNGAGGSPRPDSRGVKERLGAVKEESRNGGRSKVGLLSRQGISSQYQSSYFDLAAV